MAQMFQVRLLPVHGTYRPNFFAYDEPIRLPVVLVVLSVEARYRIEKLEPRHTWSPS